jgi:Flp pilus assembly protein TadG
MSRLSLRDDRGAVAVMTAVVMSFVLLAVSALAIDAGALFVEKRELQNAADSAALAIAENCSRRPATCTQANADATAATMAAGNADDGLSDATVTLEAGKVTVVTSTRTPSGTVMPAWFSGRSDNGRVRARSVVTWGSLGAYTGVAMTISACEWQAATSGGYPVYPPDPPASSERIVMLHTTSGISTCAAGPSGADTPGGFGWLDHNSSCVSGSTTGVLHGDPGSGIPAECKDPLAAAWAAKKPVYVPVYVQVTGSGNNTSYRIAGFAAFVVTGYYLGGSSGSQDSWLTNTKGKDLCPGKGGDGRCVAGFFTKALVTGTGGGAAYGVTVPPQLAE